MPHHLHLRAEGGSRMQNNIVCLGDAERFSTISDTYQVFLDGNEMPVYQCEVASYALCSNRGPVQVVIHVKIPFKEVKIRPLSLNICCEVNDSTLTFCVDAPAKLSIELDGNLRNPLFLLINPPDENKPSRDDPMVHYFESGKAYDAGLLKLKSGETVYIDEGAVVFGAIHANDASNVSVRGRGRLDGGKWPQGETGRQRMIQNTGCTDVLIEGVTVIGGPTWHIVHAGCSGVRIENANVITHVWTGDGIDIVGCEDFTVDNCFIRSTDDCIAIKACNYFKMPGMKNVRNVHVMRSVFWNAELGNALEIGFETRCQEIHDVLFSDCDIIHCEREGYQSGGTFTIHNGDRAVVHHVRYEDIRVEDSQEKLFDLKIQWSQYSKDKQRGQIHDIVFKDIQVVDGPFPVSILRGFGFGHIIRSIAFDTLCIHGSKITNANEARMVVEVSDCIQFV